jgi:hypothetical protein
MPPESELSCFLPFTRDSSLTNGFHILAALGGGPPHLFEVDTGSVGILVPRCRLGPDYQNFDPSLDTKFQLVSSGNVYWGQWVRVSTVLGMPAKWDGTGDYPFAEIEVFAVDQPSEFDGGIFGIGFAIGGLADGGPARNPLLHLTYLGEKLYPGYVIGSHGLDAGLTPLNMSGFVFIQLNRNAADSDWMQPAGSLGLPGGFSTDLPLLIDTGIDEMLLWVDLADRPPALANYSQLPAGVAVTIAAPPSPNAPILQYSFVTGEAGQAMAPSAVEWRDGNGINTGRHILVGVDYLYDAAHGLIGFRSPQMIDRRNGSPPL